MIKNKKNTKEFQFNSKQLFYYSFSVFFLLMCSFVHAQEDPIVDESVEFIEEISSEIQSDLISEQVEVDEVVEDIDQKIREEALSNLPKKMINSKELVRMAWFASSQRNIAQLNKVAIWAHHWYEQKASKQQATLTGFPPRTVVEEYQALNDYATVLFIRSEALMNTGQTEEAIIAFQEIIDDYSWAQAWDPRGWYWSVSEKSQASLNVLTGNMVQEEHVPVTTLKTKPYIHTKGTEYVVDYHKYGEFKKVGKKEYKYVIKDRDALIKAVGEGIYPNKAAIFKNPRYRKVRKEGRLKGNYWEFVNIDDLEAAYFKWVTAPEPEGIKLFYLGVIFEKAGMFNEALKSFHALVVHFPRTIGWTYWQTPWYPGQAAIAKIRHIIRTNPELNLEDKWMKIEIKNGYDNDPKNDIFIPFPGKIVEKNIMDQVKSNFLGWEDKVELGKIKQRVGEGRVRLVQYENGHWQLLVDNKPFIMHGITYAPTEVGQSPDKGTLKNWMEEDTNNNGKPDGPYDAWVDTNRNNKQDEDEPVVGDFQLLKEMGANVIRIYHIPETPIKEVLRDMYEKYGIMVVMSDFIGKYAIGSGAEWTEGTDYENPEHRANMMEKVKQMVLEHKDEPYVLLWLLGNENNYGVACNADTKPAAFFEFANEVAKWIKSVDPHHPVAVNNGDTLYLDIFAKHAPDIDIFSANVYRGEYGFGSFWEQVRDVADKPAFISEFGSPAFGHHMTLEEADKAQADYHHGNWMDIQENTFGQSRGQGNALGGIIFEYMDEWWKNYEPYMHDRKSDAKGPFPGGYYFEEWFGIVSQGDGKNSPFLRHPRKAYYLYKEKLWKTQ